jgi:hypothetical protein
MGYSGGSLYLFGGNTVDLASDDRLFRYDITARTWSVMATLNSPVKRALHGSCLIGSKWYILPGWSDADQADVSTVHAIDLNAPTKWEEIGVVDDRGLATRDSYAYAVTGSTVYVFGGWNEVYGINNSLISIDFCKV